MQGDASWCSTASACDSVAAFHPGRLILITASEQVNGCVLVETSMRPEQLRVLLLASRCRAREMMGVTHDDLVPYSSHGGRCRRASFGESGGVGAVDVHDQAPARKIGRRGCHDTGAACILERKHHFAQPVYADTVAARRVKAGRHYSPFRLCLAGPHAQESPGEASCRLVSACQCTQVQRRTLTHHRLTGVLMGLQRLLHHCWEGQLQAGVGCRTSSSN
jgi:hypothetical protein